MGAQGPVAAAEAAARQTALSSMPGRGPSSGSSSVHGGSDAREDGQARTEDVRPVQVGGPVFQANDGSSHGETSTTASSSGYGGVVETARHSSGDGGVVESTAPFPPSNGAVLGSERKNTGASSSRRASPSSLRRKRNANDEGYMDIISQATAVTGSALRTLWDSAWVAGSTVGSRLDGGGRAETSSRGSSSHAVLIL